MDRFDLDRHTIDYLYRLFKDGRLDLRPAYQRGRVWNDGQRYALIESVKEQFPIGLIMLNVVPYADEDGTTVDNFDVVDGQQRMRTIIEYVDAAQWAKAEHRSDFRPYAKLTNAQQKRYMDYRVPIASMKEYEPEEITECYERLQRGKTLKMGEKLKAMLTYNAHTYVQGISKHRIFDLANGAHKVRDGHWTLATAFLKSLYGSDLFARQEFKHLSSFMRGPIKEQKVGRAVDDCRKILNYEHKVLQEALQEDVEFERYVRTARTLKWVFVCLAKLFGHYSLAGRQHLASKGVVNYYQLITVEESREWAAYVNTGRTGRIDTDEVRHCLLDLTNQIIIAAKAEPVDTKRYFSSKDRELIYKNSAGKCAECEIDLVRTNFHADHIKPHAAGGSTQVSNGRALCSKCNWEKGSTWKELYGRGV